MFERIKSMLVDEIGIISDSVTRNAQLDRDLGMSGADLVNLLLIIEQELDIQLDEERLFSSITVDDLICCVSEQA